MEVDSSWHGVFRKPLSRVWNALTSDEELGAWFDVDTRLYLEPGGALIAPGGTQFRGRFYRASAKEVMPGRFIAWDWPLGTLPTNVTWTLTEQHDGTRLSVRHTVDQGADELFAPRGGESALTHFWMQDLACLKYWLDVGTLPVRSRFGELPRRDVSVALNIPVSADRIWEFLTTPAELDCWIATNAAVTCVPGGTFTFGWDHGPDRVVDVTPGRALKFNWVLEGNETFVTWSILAGTNPRDCLMRIDHVGFGIDEKHHVDEYHERWLALLHVLAVYAVTGERIGSWYGAGA